jgi:hypothetical protein
MHLWEDDASSLMREVYGALHAGHTALALMGARALLDITLTKSVGDVSGFGAKLTRATTQGVVSTMEHEFLKSAFEIGSASAHRGLRPDSRTVTMVFDIVENLMQRVYVLPGISTALKAKTPPRPSPPSASGPASSP